MFASISEKINTHRESGYPFFSLLFLYVHTNYKYDNTMYEIHQLKYEIHQLKLKLIELRHK
jgi:hypothetical protein